MEAARRAGSQAAIKRSRGQHNNHRGKGEGVVGLHAEEQNEREDVGLRRA
jgi:hypothetical protein